MAQHRELWTKEEIEVLHKYWPNSTMAEMVKFLPDRSEAAIIVKTSNEGIKKGFIKAVCNVCGKEFKYRPWRKKTKILCCNTNCYMRGLRRKIIEYLGGRCEFCGIMDIRLLQINHLNGGGNKEVREKGQNKIYREILAGKRKGEFNLLCANCNTLYEYQVGRREEIKVAV